MVLGLIEVGFNHADLAGVARSSLSSAAMAMAELGRPRASPATPMQTCNHPRPRPCILSHAHALPWTAPPPRRVKEEEVRHRRQWPDICVEQGAVRQGHDLGVLSVLELHSDEESLVHHALQALGPQSITPWTQPRVTING